MIVFFRRHRRSVVGTFIVGLCAILMLPFGAEYFGAKSVKHYIAKIDGEEVPYRLYIDELRRTESLYRAQFGEQYDVISKMINIPQRVLDDIIDRTVLSNFYKKASLTASFSQIESYTQTLPVFKNGVDRQTFESFLKSTGLSESQFGQKVKEQVIEDMFGDVVKLASLYSSSELNQRLIRANAKVKLGYTQVDSSDNQFSKSELINEISDDEVNEYYKLNKSRFFSSRKIRPVILRFPSSAFLNQVIIHDEDINEAYIRNYPTKELSINEVRSKLEKEVRDSIAPEYAKVSAESVLSSLLPLSSKERVMFVEKYRNENNSVELFNDNELISEDSDTFLIPQPLKSQVFEMKQDGIRLFFDSETPFLVFITETLESELMDLEVVKPQIIEAIKVAKQNDKSKLLAVELISEAKNLVSISEIENFLTKKGLKINYSVESMLSELKLPFLSNPLDASKIVSEIISNKIKSEPYVSIDGKVYILFLKSYTFAEDTLNKNKSDSIKSEQELVKGRAFNTILNKLKSESLIEVNHEMLVN